MNWEKSSLPFFARREGRMSYLHGIHKEFLEHVKERQEDMWKPFMREEKVPSSKLFDLIYRNLLEADKRRTFMVNYSVTKQFKCETLEKVKEKSTKFTYFTPAVYWHHKNRTKEQLIWLPCIVLEFDLTKDGTDRVYTPNELAGILLNEFEVTPNFVWDTKTKGHYAVAFLIKPLTGTEQSIYLYESIVKRMAILTGADFASTDCVHLFRIPKRKKIYQYSEEIYDIEDFSHVLQDEDIAEKLEEKRNLFQHKVTSLSERQIMNHKSIQILLNVEFQQWRNHAAFTIALLYYALGKPQEEVIDLLCGEWFQKATDARFTSKKPFTKREVLKAIKSAYSGKYAGPSKEWIYLITEEEFPFNLWRSSYVKKEVGGYQDGDEVRRKIISWIREHDGETIKQPQLAEVLEIPLRTLERNLKDLVQKNVIEMHTQKGRYSKGTTFRYIQTAFDKTYEYEVDTTLKTELPNYEIQTKKA